MVLEVPVSAIRHEKAIKVKKVRKEEVKLSSVADGLVVLRNLITTRTTYAVNLATS